MNTMHGEEKMKRKISVTITIIVLVALVFSACSKESNISSNNLAVTSNSNEKAYQSDLDAIHPEAYGQTSGLKLEPGSYISIIGRSADTPYWEMVKEGALQAATDMNAILGYKGDDKIKVNYSGPSVRDSVDEQINILDEELARYPVAVGIAIIDAQACKVQFDLAAENGIPVVAFDSGSDYDGIVSMVGTNNEEAAQTAATKLCDVIDDEGEILLLVHDSKSTTGKEREAAITTEIETNHPSVKIVKTIYLDDMEALAKEIAAEKNAALTANDNKVDAATLNETAILQYYLEKYPELVGGICTNVDATQLAVKANASLKNPNSHFMLIGFDGGEAQLQSLENGEISGLVVQNPFGIGYATVVAAARSVLELGNEAQVDTGYTWVTKDNMKNENIQKMLY